MRYVGAYAFADENSSCYINEAYIGDNIEYVANDGLGLRNVGATYITGDIAKIFDITATSRDSIGLINYANEIYVNGELLTDLVVPEGVTRINDYILYDYDLNSLTLPASIEYIGERTFGSIGTVYYNGSLAEWCGIERNEMWYDVSLYINGVELVDELVIPDDVTSIGDYAFYGCSGLAGELIIPDGVTSIGSSAFSVCTGLTSITIPGSVTSIGSSAFDGCTGLTSITIPDSVTSIGNYAFCDCTGLTNITIGNGVTSIGNYAFYGCNRLTSVTIPDSVTSIGSSAFYGCSGLTSITIGSGVTSIGDYAFSYCTGLTEINYNAVEVNDLTSSNEVFFNAGTLGDGITVTFGDTVKHIPAYLFYISSSSYRPNITSVTIGNGVMSIGNSAFSGCTGLTNVTFENPEGWSVSSSIEGTNGTSLPNGVLSDPSLAAEYLTASYSGYYWIRG